MQLINVEIDNVILEDAPYFSEAYIRYAEYEDGTPLNREEINDLPGYILEDVLQDYLSDYLDESYSKKFGC